MQHRMALVVYALLAFGACDRRGNFLSRDASTDASDVARAEVNTGNVPAWIWPPDRARVPVNAREVIVAWKDLHAMPQVMNDEEVLRPSPAWLCDSALALSCIRFSTASPLNRLYIAQDATSLARANVAMTNVAMANVVLANVVPAPSDSLAATFSNPECVVDERTYGDFCLRADETNLALRARMSEPVLASTQLGDAQATAIAIDGMVELLLPRVMGALRFEARDMAGHITSQSLTYDGAFVALPHVRIGELRANPQGNDLAGEYIELQNTGDDVAVLTDWSVQVGSAILKLPNVTLNAGATVLLVAPAFARETSGIALGVALLRLSRWFGSGLSNQAFTLHLRDATQRRIDQVRVGASGVDVCMGDPLRVGFVSELRPAICSPGY